MTARLATAAACLMLLGGLTAAPAAADTLQTLTPEQQELPEELSGNPLFGEWTAPFEAPPFDLIEPAHFLPAFERAMAIHRAEIEAIASNPAAPTFANTIEALELAGRDLDRIQRTFGMYVSSATGDEIRAVQTEISPRMAVHASDIALNEELFGRIATLHGNAGSLGLDSEQHRILDRTHTRFLRAGAELTGSDRDRLAAINEELASLQTAFGQNAQKDAEQFALVLETVDDRAGLPEVVLSAAAQAGTERGMDGQFVITVARSSFEPFMTFSTRRDLREKLFRGWTNRGNNGNEFDNEDTIRRILLLRLEQARLLGHENYAAYRTADTMAGTPQNAKNLLDEVWAGALAKAEAEAAEIRAIMVAEGADHDLMPWDWWFYAEKARAANHALDEDEVKAYLSLDNILRAKFAVAERLFGVTFHERDDIPVFHPDVRVWEMLGEDGEHRGLFYGDYFARPGKRSGAWMSVLRNQHKLDGEVTPHITNSLNYNKPAPGQPALITLGEAEVIFHEFGHGLHGLLSDVTYPSIACTAVDFDFVEFPAQIMEHWMREPAIIREFALHHETGEPMPVELLERVQAAANAKSGFDNVEFIASAFVDLAFHRLTDPEIIAALDVNAFEDGVLAQAGRPDAIEMRHRSPHFRHSFGSAFYAGGYYTYLWAGVLDNDGYAAFTEAGDPFDPAAAGRLHDQVYSAGNKRPAMEAFVGFRGHEPDTGPLIENRGLDVGTGE